MRKLIDTYIQSIAHDNELYIRDGGYESIANYIISSAENGTGFGEFFDSEELEDNGNEPTEEQIDDLKEYLNEYYDYVPDIDGNGKIVNLDCIKVYPSNMTFEFRDHNGWNGSHIYENDFRDEEDLPVKESDARDILDELYGIIGPAADTLIDEMYTFEWIISDDEVYLYQVKTTDAYRMDEQGIRWMTHVPYDTRYYKYEMLDCKTEHLPAGFTFDAESENFFDGDLPAEMVNENDGSVSLVSSERNCKWF